MADGQFIAYYRVSTARQGQSGLGLEAQRTSVLDWLNGGDHQLVAEFTEIETGTRKRQRPELNKAIVAAKKAGAILVIAKLDRLARDVHFVSGLHKADVEFVAVDNPHANKMTIQILAVMAEHEAEMISARTRAALAAAKARGTLLGSANPKIRKGALAALERARPALIASADQHANDLAPVIDGIRRAGATTLQALADALNARGIPTARGGKWYPTTVKNILDRMEAA